MIVNNADEIFDKIHRDDFKELISLAKNYEDIPEEFLLQQYDTGNTALEQLQEQWVKSLQNNNPDYSVYAHPLYMNESFNCWKIYARRYLQLLSKYLKRPDCVIDKDSVETILDLGCGCAYSTVGLKSLFADADVAGTNLADTLQYNIDMCVTSNISDCYIVDESLTLKLPSVDMVFASEFFEHLQEPIALLESLIQTYNPRYFVFANTFTRMSIGHFFKYLYNGSWYTGKEITRIFGTYLRKHGYARVQTGFYNGRPQIYYRRPVFKLHRLFEVNDEK